MTNSKGDVEIIHGMTHAEYIDNIKYDKTLRFEFSALFSNEQIFLKGSGKIIFSICVFAYMIAPLLLVPIFAYKYSNWYLLFGIAFCYLSTFLEMRKIIKFIYAYCIFYLAWYWYDYGFHLDDYGNFFGLCIFWGSSFYYIATIIEDEFAKGEIVKNEELFNKLSEDKIIFFGRKASS